jgi:hypothetical protein
MKVAISTIASANETNRPASHRAKLGAVTTVPSYHAS